FDALKPGEGFILVTDSDPKPFLLQFQAGRPGRFEWNVLEAGPARFRVDIRRRATESPRSVTEYLERDHRRLDAIIPEVERLAGERSFPEAGERFAEFVCGLGRHIDAEEQVLFPAFEQITGMTQGGPTYVMRAEHVDIRRLMGEVSAALATADASGAERSIRGLLETLGLHNIKEERMLYPMADQAARDDQTRDDLVKRLQAV
ncbi:MAG: hemerythrin domain-containing protein, partial [Acidobacteria bacterium]|nr:hemerythrin domain-containing protein [Acidobacteriota bacterium]